MVGQSARPPARLARARLDHEAIEQMTRALRVQTDDCVMETFGISVNTWFKLKKGEAVRASVVERLMERLRTKGFAIPDLIAD